MQMATCELIPDMLACRRKTSEIEKNDSFSAPSIPPNTDNAALAQGQQ